MVTRNVIKRISQISLFITKIVVSGDCRCFQTFFVGQRFARVGCTQTSTLSSLLGQNWVNNTLKFWIYLKCINQMIIPCWLRPNPWPVQPIFFNIRLPILESSNGVCSLCFVSGSAFSLVFSSKPKIGC